MGCNCKNILNLQPVCTQTVNIEAQCKPVVNITDGTQGTLLHDHLKNRDLPDQHPISAIAGLQDNLDGLSGDLVAEAEARQEADANLQAQIDNMDIGDIVGGSNIEVTEDNRVFTISSKTFTFEQGIASNTWTINHNLGKHPSIQLVDSSGRVFEADREYTSENQVIIHLQSATTGFAYLN